MIEFLIITLILVVIFCSNNEWLKGVALNIFVYGVYALIAVLIIGGIILINS